MASLGGRPELDLSPGERSDRKKQKVQEGRDQSQLLKNFKLQNSVFLIVVPEQLIDYELYGTEKAAFEHHEEISFENRYDILELLDFHDRSSNFMNTHLYGSIHKKIPFDHPGFNAELQTLIANNQMDTLSTAIAATEDKPSHLVVPHINQVIAQLLRQSIGNLPVPDGQQSRPPKFCLVKQTSLVKGIYERKADLTKLLSSNFDICIFGTDIGLWENGYLQGETDNVLDPAKKEAFPTPFLPEYMSFCGDLAIFGRMKFYPPLSVTNAFQDKPLRDHALKPLRAPTLEIQFGLDNVQYPGGVYPTPWSNTTWTQIYNKYSIIISTECGRNDNSLEVPRGIKCGSQGWIEANGLAIKPIISVAPLVFSCK
ncbi:hypothetical protein SEMRO_172_G075870.1 [Seminavis robusta]|uniref:Uncharacterized protein n=1 Tax=Seminavis robusta TaxID=568900 RepID=A0A9N8DPN3_9STRA|nr:hypothetical protein SEMRO_172_G075870.1 [Seminavis robusta]|eukprot:Sro172_g075870.1 n/a (370) ;mRNA; r:6563-7672